MVWEIAGAVILAFLFAVFAVLPVRRFALWVGAVRAPGGRHWHEETTPLLGGAAVLFAIVIVAVSHATLVLTPPILALLFGFLFLLLVGFLDDRFELSWKTLLISQVLVATALLLGGVRLDYVNAPFGLLGQGGAIRLDAFSVVIPESLCFSSDCALPVIGSLLVIAWVVAVMNAFNWLDGSDGVAVSVAALVFFIIGVLSLTAVVDQPPIAILAAIGFGAAFGFLVWNRPPARIFLGSSGSFGLGFFIAALAVIAGAKLAAVAMVLLLPAADAASVLLMRRLHGDPLTSPDTRHLHHVLIERGWSLTSILLLHMLATSIFGLAAIFLPQPAKAAVLFGVFIVLVTTLTAMKLRTADVAV